jgi:hypothetical protein
MCCPGQTQLDVGQLVVRPMHRSHTFEAALLLTEAFLGERRPPSFPWMLCAPPTCSYFQGYAPPQAWLFLLSSTQAVAS